MKPLAIDLFAGLGGWAEGLLAEGYDVIGFDIERHVYGDHRYPAQLVIQDVRTLHGSQFKDATLIVASPPCQAYSYRAMPWKRAKALPPPDNTLFETCFRIQREACEAAGRHIPLIVENVRGAQKWVGRARFNFGSYHFWGDVPALMPPTSKAAKVPGLNWSRYGERDYKGEGFNTHADRRLREAGEKGAGPAWDPATKSGAHGMKRWTNPAEGIKQHGSGAAWFDKALDERRKEATGIKNSGGGADGWFGSNPSPMRQHNSQSSSRKFASAMIAKIPFEVSIWIARCFKPISSHAQSPGSITSGSPPARSSGAGRSIYTTPEAVAPRC